jgi:hypothetical protein
MLPGIGFIMNSPSGPGRKGKYAFLSQLEKK